MLSLTQHQSSDFTIPRRGVYSPITRPARFWKKVSKTDTCWLWTGYIDKNGYGRFEGRLAHRVVYNLLEKPLNSSLEICHSCQNKNCVNPDHHYEGTHKQNMEDASRDKVMRGPQKLSPADFAAMRRLKATGVSQRKIAKSIGCSESLVSGFFSGRFVHAKP